MNQWKDDPQEELKWKIFDAMCEDPDDNLDFTMAQAWKAIDDMLDKLLPKDKS